MNVKTSDRISWSLRIVLHKLDLNNQMQENKEPIDNITEDRYG